ncbi:hypothetical protein RND81_06G203100 [Saponaria officinalis]
MKNKRGRKRGDDRLSSLPDDILIRILSHLPLQLAVVSECLSSRWRGLWTHITSINIQTGMSKYYVEFLKEALDDIRSRIVSPFIYSFTFEFLHGVHDTFGPPSLDSWVQQICDRNVRELKLTWRHCCAACDRHKFPSVIFRTRSLVSIELGSTSYWVLPNDCEPINLPNLKILSINLCPPIYDWFEKQIKLCPSLEQLSLKCEICYGNLPGPRIMCSNQNLRLLSINFAPYTINHILVIDAPKIEYLAINAPNLSTFSFATEPVMLREAKIEFELDKVYGLTLDMPLSKSISIVLSVLEMFPVLDVLTLKFNQIDAELDPHSLQKLRRVKDLGRILKRIEIEGHIPSNGRSLGLLFLALIECLLSNAEDLEHFRVNLDAGQSSEYVNVKRNKSVELKLCELLYRCPMKSKGCEVEFVGRCFTMSRKAGPIVKTVKGKVMSFNCSTWKSLLK